MRIAISEIKKALDPAMQEAARKVLDGNISYHVAVKSFQVALAQEARKRTQSFVEAGKLLGLNRTQAAKLADFGEAKV